MIIAFNRIAPSLLVIAFAAACSDGPAAPARTAPAPVFAAAQGADRSVREGFYDYDGSVVQLPCGPDGAYTEEIQLSGKIYVRQTTMFDASGGAHIVDHTMPVGLGGVGLTSGATYRISEREHLVFNSTATTGNSTYRLDLKFSAPEIGVRGRLVLGGHYTFNESAGIVVERPTLHGECTA